MEEVEKEEEEEDHGFHELKDVGRLAPLSLFKQLFAHFTAFLEIYVHPSALAAAMRKAGAAQQPYAPADAA